MISIKLVYFVTLVIAFVVSLFKFKSLPKHLRMFSILLGLTVLVEYISMYHARTINTFFNWHGKSWLYDPFGLIEFSAYFYYFYLVISIPVIKKAIKLLLWLYPVFWLFTVVFIFKLSSWNSYIAIIGGACTVLLVLAYLYQLLQIDSIIQIKYSTEFWIAIGLFIFYSCEIPYFGTLNFLIKNYPNLAVDLANLFLVIDTIMYLIFSYAFLCRIITKKSL